MEDVTAQKVEERREPLFQQIARAVDARRSCIEHHNDEWIGRWEARLDAMVLELPRGGGFDDYPKLDLDASTGQSLVFTGSFHKMDDIGMYDGWQDYTITVKGSLIHVIDVDANLEDYNPDDDGDALGECIYQAFDLALREEFLVRHFAVDMA
jgi:hypothetical protein